MRIILVCLVLLLLAFDSRGQPTGGESITFASADAKGTPIQLAGVLYVPQGESKGAVVLVHGSDGWNDMREGHYGRALSRAGYAALAIDSFGPRGVGSTVEDQARVTVTQMALDSLAARRLLLRRGFSAEKMAVMGFSKGGSAAMFTADRTMVPSEVDRFPLVIPFYPGCNSHPVQPRPASAVFMALGDMDDWTGVKPCQQLAAKFQSAGGRITVKIYPDSAHGFDGDPANLTMVRLSTVENYLACIVDVEPDGTQMYGGKRFAYGDPAILSELKRTCVRKGASTWTNPRQKQVATQDVLDFLDIELRAK